MPGAVGDTDAIEGHASPRNGDCNHQTRSPRDTGDEKPARHKSGIYMIQYYREYCDCS